MSDRIRGEVRRAQLITTYGVGAVVALQDESFMVAGADRWEVTGPNLYEPLLQRALGVRGFVQPPASEGRGDVPVVRFPAFSSCPMCKRLDWHRNLANSFSNKCNRCAVPLVPSRFIVACEKGHAADFPYARWVHDGMKPESGDHQLQIEAAGRSASLRDIEIRCSCGAWRDMGEAFSPRALRGISRCLGIRPWLDEHDRSCNEPLRVVQRGASNVWFPVVRSAISIPPWSETTLNLLDRHWTVLRSIPEEALPSTLTSMLRRDPGDSRVQELVDAVLARRRDELEGGAVSMEEIRRQEFQALSRGRIEESSGQEFVCVETPSQFPRVRRYFERVMVVSRLREVRALTGFTRVRPPETASEARERMAPLSAEPIDWLPAIEVRGEGVFIEIDPERLAAWESLQSVRKRAAILDSRYADRARRSGSEPDRKITPRFLLLHTLAHSLIDQWSLDSGYSAASLRERIYCGRDMAGILVYTASSDAAGSLGGLAAQAQPERLDVSMFESIERARWCSSDPLCVEADAGGVDALNLGACHACCLLPEVSCEEMNMLLDRGLLIGTPDDPTLAFFAEE